MGELDLVFNFLRSKSIHTSSLWVSSCIDWFKSEHQDDHQIATLNKAIYEQWLLSDLRDIEVGCLPENLKSFKKFTLIGKYAVQVEHVIDVSQPAYSQLQKIRNISTVNEQITAERNEFARPSASRVLNLYLCDGVQDVKGMEFRPIPKLNTNLTPGVKVLLIGPIECRRGVLFLHDKNVTILGGEIEDLVCKNAYENVLARICNLPENLNPKQEQNFTSHESNEEVDFDDDDIIAGINIEEIAQNALVHNEPASITLPSIDNTNNLSNQINNTVKETPNKPLVNASFDLDDFVDFNDFQFEGLFENSIKNNTSSNESSPVIVSNVPYVYIDQLVKQKELILNKKFTIKAYVDSFVSKLSFAKKQWGLKCILSDPTGSITCDFSNAVLEKITGYTAAEMPILRKEMLSSNFHKDQLLQALEKAKKKILSMNCLMNIEFQNDKDVDPVVLSIEQVSLTHVNSLKSRIEVSI